MRNFASTRRGLSTIVTSAIMLTAVAILGSTMVSWSNGNLRAFETSLSNTYSTNMNKLNEFVTIENIAFCKNCYGISQHDVNLTLTNTGTVSLNVTSIKINNSVFAITSGRLLPGKSNLWELNYTWQSQIPLTISISTSRGSLFTTQAAAP